MSENQYTNTQEQVLQEDDSTLKHIYISEKYDEQYELGEYTDSPISEYPTDGIGTYIKKLQVAIETTDVTVENLHTRLETTEPVENDIESRFMILCKDFPVSEIEDLFESCYMLNEVDETTSLQRNETAELQLQGLDNGKFIEIDVHTNEIDDWTLFTATYTVHSSLPN